MNPISEMKAHVETKTELMINDALQAQFKAAKKNRLQTMRENLTEYNTRKVIAANTPMQAPKPESVVKAALPQAALPNDDIVEKVLAWAKDNYHSYKDIPAGAQACDTNAGAVYRTLKAHGLVAEQDTTEYRVIKAYFKYSGNLRFMTEDLGLGVWVVAKTVEALGYSPRWHEYRESRYLSRSNFSGVGAEAEFKKLVPSALDMNEDYQECNPVFDFVVNGKTVDVKEYTQSYDRRVDINSYRCRISKRDRPDYYCLFLCHDKEKRIKGGYTILLIPTITLPKESSSFYINADPNSDGWKRWSEFAVDPNSLNYILTGEL
ncbi:riboflavin synthase subunit alpha [Pasteurellaceae bacterium HPA106]|uniref:riboflavin synthase subunit alpha n=1 Tax=Spirabiliibacterium pneumoniae TaxID=221400 RepID=UPI001AACB5A7|nr:riboflavin synthase subunit alpha [Spirabiliibacterium pneumoniae]MBE2895756.1 riboflavin synthase subunit alpha [Spirabiliibacterium pneumoniae]